MDLVEITTSAIEDTHDPISSRSYPRLRPLGKTVSLESNLLGVPIGVLHATSAKKNKCLSYAWKTDHGRVEYLFERISDEDSFPIPTHTRFFDVLVALFATIGIATECCIFVFLMYLPSLDRKSPKVQEDLYTSVFAGIRDAMRAGKIVGRAEHILGIAL